MTPFPVRLLRRAAGLPQLEDRLARQDAATAELRQAVDAAVLKLDQRLLDLYALTEAVRAELAQRLLELTALTEAARSEARAAAGSLETALTSPESALAEHVSAEAARLDSYLVHHVAQLRSDIAAVRGDAPQPDPGHAS